MDKSFPLAPLDEPYSVTKALGDRLVERMILEDALPATIIRPDTIFGLGDAVHVGRMSERLRAGRSIIVGSGRNAMPFLYVSERAIAEETGIAPPRLHVPYSAREGIQRAATWYSRDYMSPEPVLAAASG